MTAHRLAFDANDNMTRHANLPSNAKFLSRRNLIQKDYGRPISHPPSLQQKQQQQQKKLLD